MSYYELLSTVPRRDGIIVQSQPKGDYNNADISVDRAEAERSVQTLADLMARMK